LRTSIIALQIKPRLRIAPRDPVGKMFPDKNPVLPCFTARDFTRLGFATKHFRVHFQEFGGFDEVKGFDCHGS
jgi:hypothetical protein